MRPRILVVEDHGLVRDLLAHLLAPYYDVVGTLPDGSGLAEEVAANRPDLILLDSRFPDGDGLGLVDSALGGFPARTVVLLTAYPSPSSLPPSGGRPPCRRVEPPASRGLERHSARPDQLGDRPGTGYSGADSALSSHPDSAGPSW